MLQVQDQSSRQFLMNVLIGGVEDVTMNASTSSMPRMKRDGPLKIFPVPPGNITQTNAGNHSALYSHQTKPKIEENCFLQGALE